MIGRVAWSLFSAALMVWACSGVSASVWSEGASEAGFLRDSIASTRRAALGRTAGRPDPVADLEASAAFTPFCLASAQLRFLPVPDDLEGVSELRWTVSVGGILVMAPARVAQGIDSGLRGGGGGCRAPPRFA